MVRCMFTSHHFFIIMFDTHQKLITVLSYKDTTHKDIAKAIGKKPKAVAEFLRSRNLLKRSNYTETEVYIISNFPASTCAKIINKSINAIKIKQCRLKKRTLAN